MKTDQFEFNKIALLNAMREAGIDSTVIYYEGGGDDGAVGDIAFFASGKQYVERSPMPVKLKMDKSTWDETTKSTVVTEVEVERPIREALHDFLWSCVDAAGHAGWENNDGGYGRLTLDAIKKTCSLVHSENIVYQNDYAREF